MDHFTDKNGKTVINLRILLTGLCKVKHPPLLTKDCTVVVQSTRLLSFYCWSGNQVTDLLRKQQINKIQTIQFDKVNYFLLVYKIRKVILNLSISSLDMAGTPCETLIDFC